MQCTRTSIACQVIFSCLVGLLRATRAFDVLGYVFESGSGDRYPDSPPVRQVTFGLFVGLSTGNDGISVEVILNIFIGTWHFNEYQNFLFLVPNNFGCGLGSNHLKKRFCFSIAKIFNRN